MSWEPINFMSYTDDPKDFPTKVNEIIERVNKLSLFVHGHPTPFIDRLATQDLPKEGR